MQLHFNKAQDGSKFVQLQKKFWNFVLSHCEIWDVYSSESYCLLGCDAMVAW
jgi:hypothetical protein